jgi:hypothetical protein
VPHPALAGIDRWIGRLGDEAAAVAYSLFGERLNDKAKLVAGSGPKPTASSNQFEVLIADNFHFMDPDDPPYKHSSYPTLEAAIAFCKRRIDEDLKEFAKPGRSEAEIYRHYCMFGEDPYVVGPCEGVLFSGWSYAKLRCDEMFAPPRPVTWGERVRSLVRSAWAELRKVRST